MPVVSKHRRKTKQPPAQGLEHGQSIKELMQIPGVGVSIANDLWNIDIKGIAALQGKDPEVLYDLSNKHVGMVQDRCLLYVFKCAVYYAETPAAERNPELLKWWNWKNHPFKHR